MSELDKILLEQNLAKSELDIRGDIYTKVWRDDWVMEEVLFLSEKQ